MSAKYLSCKEPSSHAAHSDPTGARATPRHMHTNTHRPTWGPGHPHVLGLDAGLLGPDVAVVLITLMVPPPLPLSHNEAREVGVQLVFLVDASLLDAVPALLLGDAQSAGNVISEVEPLLLPRRPTSLQVGDGLVIALHLQLALPQEKVCLHRLPVQLQGTPAVGQGLLMLLHLQVAQCPVCVIHRHQGIPGLGTRTAGRRLRILAAHEEPVALLLELLRARALLGASTGGAQSRATLLLLLAFHGAARHGLGSAPRLRARPALCPQPEPAARDRDPLGPGPAIRHRNFRPRGAGRSERGGRTRASGRDFACARRSVGGASGSVRSGRRDPRRRKSGEEPRAAQVAPPLALGAGPSRSRSDSRRAARHAHQRPRPRGRSRPLRDPALEHGGRLRAVGL
uniref:Uncharacterized protein n=1 Tax=Rhinolophus ferrumequinum TaxID=59479 RepID=A0A671FFL8_RHIFE